MGRRASFWCIGCGKKKLSRHWSYCTRCQARLAQDLPLDLESYPTKADCRRACKALDKALAYLKLSAPGI